MKHPPALKPLVTPQTLRRISIVCWLGALLWAGAIFYLSSKTGHELAQMAPFAFWDKAAHAIAFAAGAVPVTLALRLSVSWPWKKVLLVSIALVSLYGIADEIHQLWTPFRSGGDVGDWLADTLGAILGALAAAFLYARSSRTHLPAPART